MFLLRRVLTRPSTIRHVWSPAATVLPSHPSLGISAHQLHTCRTLSAKLFVDNENRYAHSILQNNDRYHVVRNQKSRNESLEFDTVPAATDAFAFLDTVNWSTLNAIDIVAHFDRIAQLCGRHQLCISNERFDAFVDAFCGHCFRLSDDQLLAALNALAHIPQTPSLNTRNFLELWSVLDDACVERILGWTVPQILLACDHWYLLHLGKVNQFNWHAAKKLGRKVRKLPAHQLVQTMFYTNLLRNPTCDMMDFEVRMAQCLAVMSLDEIAIMCMGFFKTQTSLRSPDLVTQLYTRLMGELGTVQDISFVNILKMLRYSSKLVHVPDMQRLLAACVPQIERLSLLSCLHVLLLGTDMQLLHAPSAEACLQRFAAADVADIRLKDMERVAFVLGLYDYRSASGVADVLSKRFLAELKTRVPEIMRHPRCLPACLQFLSYRGWADAELIGSVLDEKYCMHAYGKNVSLGRELFALDSFAKIDLRATYAGPVLAEKRRRQMGILLVHYIPTREGGHKLTATDRILLEMKEAVEREVGACRLAHVLPHFDRPGG